MGDWRNIALAVGNRGLVHRNCGESAEALSCFEEEEQIVRELGDRRSIAIAVDNRGIVYTHRGEHAEALACFQQAADEHRAIGVFSGVAHWLSRIAHVWLALSEEGIQSSSSIPEDLQNIDQKNWRPTVLQKAREAVEEYIAVNQNSPSSSRILLARLEAVEGDRDTAGGQLKEMLAEATETEDLLQRDQSCAELCYWLWRIEEEESRTEKDRAEALRLYRSLYEKTPKHEYLERIQELGG